MPQDGKTEEDMFEDFLQGFGDRDEDGKIYWQEWVLNYCGLSASFDNDEEFILMMTNAWNLNNEEYEKGVRVDEEGEQ